jgi:DNA repair protein RecO (recombination protein O)
MHHQTKGIVLSNTKYAETSIICKIYTELFGLQSYIINGVRKKKGKSIYYQPLSILELNVLHKEKKRLQRIKESKPFYQYQSLPYAVTKSAIAFFIAEILQKCLKEEEENSALFNFLTNSLIKLDKETLNPQFHLEFLIELSMYLGFYPNTQNIHFPFFDLINGTFTSSKPDHKHYINDTKPLIDLIEGRVVEKSQKKIVLEKIIEYYKLHIEGFKKLNSKTVLETIFN